MTRVFSYPIGEAVPALLSERQIQSKQEFYDNSLCITFECLMNKVWLRIPPSLAIYDLSFDNSIRMVMEDLRKGTCLKGVSGTVYRLSNTSSENLPLGDIDVWKLYMNFATNKYQSEINS